LSRSIHPHSGRGRTHPVQRIVLEQLRKRTNNRLRADRAPARQGSRSTVYGPRVAARGTP
jgi:hypothetical protein